MGESAGVMFALLIGHRSRFGNAAERERERENNIEKYDTLVSVVRYARCESEREREGWKRWRMRAREAEKDGKTKIGNISSR